MLPDFVAFLAALAPLSYAAPGNSARHVLHERREESSDWVKRGSLHRDALLPMRIGLPQSNLHRGHDWLMEVYASTTIAPKTNYQVVLTTFQLGSDLFEIWKLLHRRRDS